MANRGPLKKDKEVINEETEQVIQSSDEVNELIVEEVGETEVDAEPTEFSELLEKDEENNTEVYSPLPDTMEDDSIPNNISNKPKLVKIVTSVNHSCSIGGVRYNFNKGTQYNVPNNVKDVLRKANILAAL